MQVRSLVVRRSLVLYKSTHYPGGLQKISEVEQRFPSLIILAQLIYNGCQRSICDSRRGRCPEDWPCQGGQCCFRGSRYEHQVVKRSQIMLLTIASCRS